MDNYEIQFIKCISAAIHGKKINQLYYKNTDWVKVIEKAKLKHYYIFHQVKLVD